MRMRFFCLLLALLLALGCGLATAEEAIAGAVEVPVEEVELSLGEDIPEAPEVRAEPAEDAPAEPLPVAEPEADGELPEPQDALVKLNLPKKIVLGVKEKVRLEPVPEPEGAACRLRYSSAKKTCAKVSRAGLVTGLKKGTTTITVKADNGVKAKVKVVVRAAPKKITVSADLTRLPVGGTAQLKCKLPKGSAGAYAYSVKPEGIVEVSPEGVVTALKTGVAKVTATTYNKKSASVDISVLPPFEITFLDIGRNDGIVIQCGGEYAFIDAGRYSFGSKAVKYLKDMGVPHLKYYIGTHAHEDHVSAAPRIIAAFGADEVIVSHKETAELIRRSARKDAEKTALEKVKYRVVKVGDSFSLGGAVFEVLGPVKIVKVSYKEDAENVNSRIMRLTYGKNTFLLTGDATNPELDQVEAANPGCLKAQVLKNPHHRNKTLKLVRICKPRIVVFCTANYYLPDSAYLRMLKKEGVRYYITAPNRNGNVTIASDGRKLSVTTQK